MSARVKFAVGAAAGLLALAAMFGFSIRSYQVDREMAAQANAELEPDTAVTMINQPLDPLSLPLVSEPFQVGIGDQGDQLQIINAAYSEPINPLEIDTLDFNDVRDVQIDGNEILLATAGGIVKFFPADSSYVLYSFPQGLENYDCYAVLQIDELIYVGTGGGVYCIDEIGQPARIWEEIDDLVTTLDNYGEQFLVGSKKRGLFSVEDDIVENILPDKSIVAVTRNPFGLWVATRDSGLFCHDGERWRRRYLRADTASFTEVNCLESAFQRVWLGTPKGVYVYDGGRWELVNAEDNLYDENVTSIARGRNFIYFGTAASGLFSYFNGTLCPLDWSEGLAVTTLAVSTGRYLVGTQKEGATFKTPRRRLHIQSLFDQVGELAVSF